MIHNRICPASMPVGAERRAAGFAVAAIDTGVRSFDGWS